MCQPVLVTTHFVELVSVDACCIELPFEGKCVACQTCVKAWAAYHEFCDGPGPRGESNYPYYINNQEMPQWEKDLDAFVEAKLGITPRKDNVSC